MNKLIQKASINDSRALSDLTLRSKAYWGYSTQQLEEWSEDLRITKKYISENEVFTLKENDQILGYYSCKLISRSTVKLDNIFIDPVHIAKGMGTTLMTDFLDRVKKLQISIITLDSEPHAEQFYRRFGFVTVGQLESAIPNRFLPIMELNLPTK